MRAIDLLWPQLPALKKCEFKTPGLNIGSAGWLNIQSALTSQIDRGGQIARIGPSPVMPLAVFSKGGNQ